MLFPTIDFAMFFVVVFTAAWLLRPWATGWKAMILVASFVFYGWWDWHFVALLVASIVLNQTGALLAGTRRGSAALAATIAADVGLLAWFKYYGFFSVNVSNGLHRLGIGFPLPLLVVVLPVGVSFFTFMGISYVVDVHRGRLPPAGWLDAAVYLSFFPHLVAGPIVRGSELLPQLRGRRDPTRHDTGRAAWLIMAGLAKKVVVSSFLAKSIVDPVFAFPGHHSAPEVLVGVYGYAVQIYADFSGYTDIAIGIALLLGIRFPDNFNAPYTAVSIQDFWRRWHITLSSWLRDYVYIPLGGSRGGTWRTARNVFVTMLLGGLWHGAAWTFVAWGALHGGAQVVGMLRRRTNASRRAAPRQPVAALVGSAHGGTIADGAVTGGGAIDGQARGEGYGGAAMPTAPPPSAVRLWGSRLVTFHVVCLGWVLFRAQSFANALAVLARLGHPGAAPLVTPLVIGVIVVSIASQYVDPHIVTRAQARFSELGSIAQGAILAGALYVVTTLGPQGVAPFIYYRF